MTMQTVGDHERISELSNVLLDKLGEWVNEHPETEPIDVFMAAHSFHKLIVMTLAQQLEPQTPATQTFRNADMTFRKAMKELWRNAG